MKHHHRRFPELRSTKFKPLSLAIFSVIFGCAGLIIILSKAAPTPPTVYLSPTSQTLGPNGTIAVQIRENSGTTGVNAVQANFSYPTGLLTCTSVNTSTSAFGIQAQASCSNGQVMVAMGVTGGAAPLTGDQLVGIVNFSAATTSGSAALAFTSGTALVSASNNQDILGSLAATGGATYTIDATAPTVSLSAPANNATLALGNVTITASATDTSAVNKVDIYIDNALKATLTSAPYTYTWASSLGAHTIQAKATDAYGNVGSSALTNVTVTDQTAPSVSLTAPAAGATPGGTISVSASASDNVGVTGVQFKLDGTNLGAEDTTSPYSISWNTTTATNGSHSLTAVARDAAGNTTTSSAVTVTVDNAAPTTSITAPTGGASVNGTVAVNVSATDNTGGTGVAKVEFYIDGTLKSTDTTSPYSYSWDTTTISNGTHSLTAKAYDKATPVNIATTAAITVTVNNPDTQAPTAPGNLQAGGTTTSSTTLTWTASTDNVGVTGYQIRRNGTLITTTNALTYADSGLSPATAYTYTVAAVDAAGNVSPTAGPLTVNTPPLKLGDANHDGTVNILDLSILLTNYGSQNSNCDFNSDGTVNILDLSILLTHYGQ